MTQHYEFGPLAGKLKKYQLGGYYVNGPDKGGLEPPERVATCYGPNAKGNVELIARAFNVQHGKTDHWADDADWPTEAWRDDVARGDTRLGYADWVAHCREAAKSLTVES